MKRTEYKAIDVARHIVNYTNEQGKTVSNLKLQKLLYFKMVPIRRTTT